MQLTSIESRRLSAKVSARGAELHSLKVDGTEYLWQAGEAWTRHAPVLFPIVGRLKDNTYYYKGKPYNLPQHGFARDMEFNLVESTGASCVYELKSSEKTLAVYPFHFRLRITYAVSENTLDCRYDVGNEGGESMLFGIGAHPGFLCPFVTGEKFEDYYLAFERHTLLQTSLQEGLRSEDTKVLPMQGKNVEITGTLFDNDALVFEKGQVNKVSLVSKPSGKKLTLECEGWPFFGVWSKKGNREFVCLEPWYGITDHVNSTKNLEEKDGMQRLEPGDRFSCRFSVSII